MKQKPFGTEGQIGAREAQRRSVEKRKYNQDRLAAILAEFKHRPADREQLDEADRLFLTMTKKELHAFAYDDNKPADLRARARQWLHEADKDGVEMGEKIRDRSFGKPKQSIEAEVTSAPAPVFADFINDDL